MLSATGHAVVVEEESGPLERAVDADPTDRRLKSAALKRLSSMGSMASVLDAVGGWGERARVQVSGHRILPSPALARCITRTHFTLRPTPAPSSLRSPPNPPILPVAGRVATKAGVRALLGAPVVLALVDCVVMRVVQWAALASPARSSPPSRAWGRLGASALVQGKWERLQRRRHRARQARQSLSCPRRF